MIEKIIKSKAMVFFSNQLIFEPEDFSLLNKRGKLGNGFFVGIGGQFYFFVEGRFISIRAGLLHRGVVIFLE